MGDTYTRQSSYTDGDVITAAHTNNEFNQLLAAFASSSGHTHDGTAAEGGPISVLLSNTLTFGTGADTDIAITFNANTSDGVLTWKEDEDYFEFSDDILIASTEKLQFRDTAIYINSSTDGQLDLVADTEIQIAATTVDINGAVDISGNLGIGGNLTVTGTTTFNGGTLTLGDANTDNIVFGGEIDSNIIPDDDDTHDLGSASKQWKDIYIDGVAYLDSIDLNGTVITSTAAELNILDGVTSTAAELNILDGVTSTAAELNILDGVTSTAAELNALDGITAVVGELNALDIGSTAIGTAVASKAVILDANKDYTGIRNLTLAGDLTISGDDLTMATNTAGALLIADGTNFNPTVITDLSEISTIASGDIFLAIDASGGGLKKVARSTVVSGLATSSAISNVVEDTSPQLGGNLDLNGADIVTTSNATLDLAPNGTGTVVVRGNTNSGAIVFNCESNSHGQTVQAQPHSASVTNTMLLPAGSNSTLVSLVSTDTLTNKTLTAPTLTGTATVASLDISGDIDVDGTTNLDVVDIDGAVNMATTATITGNLTLGAQLIMPDVTSTKILVADGTSFQEVAVSGDITIANTGAVTIANTAVETAMIAADAITGAKIADDAINSEHYTDGSIDTAHIADSQVTTDKVAADAITEAKIADNAVESEHINDNVISGQTALASGIADTDELLISDAGTIKRTDMSVIKTYIGAADDATALAIALG